MSSVQRILKGDIIIERTGGKDRMIPVRKVEYNACSSKGVHINTSMCFDSTAVVRLVDGEGTLGDLRDEVEEAFDPGVMVNVGDVRVSDNGVNEKDMDSVMDNIMAIADKLVKQ